MICTFLKKAEKIIKSYYHSIDMQLARCYIIENELYTKYRFVYNTTFLKY